MSMSPDSQYFGDFTTWLGGSAALLATTAS